MYDRIPRSPRTSKGPVQVFSLLFLLMFCGYFGFPPILVAIAVICVPVALTLLLTSHNPVTRGYAVALLIAGLVALPCIILSLVPWHLPSTAP